jgi:anti-anti-sigma factor
VGDLGVVVTDLESGVTVIALTGKLGVTAKGRLAKTLESVRARGVRRVVLDLAQVPDVYSVTAGLILQHAEQLRSGGGALVIARARPTVKLHLEMLGLADRLRLCGSLDEAVRAAC